MKRKYFLLPVIMGLFDGGAAGAGAPAGAAASDAAPAAGNAEAQGEAKGKARGAASRGKSGENSEPTILYGKQPQQEQAKAEHVQQPDAAAADNKEALRSEFLKLANGKYKDAYTAEVQKIIDNRFRNAKVNEQQLTSQQPIIELLSDRYGITDGDMTKLYKAVVDNDPTVEARAEDNGMTVEQQKRVDEMERELAQLRKIEQDRVRNEQAQQTTNKWIAEAEAMKQAYPNFDLRTEVQNQEFLALLRANIPMQHAYEVLHRDEINNNIRAQAAAASEKRVVDNIRAQGMRPRENGTSSQGSFVVKSDPRTLTRADHDKIRERVRHGEKIRF